MTISWGAWKYGSNGQGFRVGVEATRSTVTTSSPSVTWTLKWYLGATGGVFDSMTLTYGGNISGSETHTYDHSPLTPSTVLWDTKTYTYTYTTYGTSPGSRVFSGSLSGVYNGAAPSHSITVAIPARPYAAPTAPSAVVATRNSDTQVTVTWTRNVTAQKPYSSQLIQMRTYQGSGAAGDPPGWSAWTDVASVSGTAASYVKAGLSANRVYQFAVRASNSAGSSAFGYSGNVYMTPGAPSGVASSLTAGGAIVTTWANTAYLNSGVTYTVERSVAGGAYAEVATGIDITTPTYTDPTPGVGTNQYRVKAVQVTGSLSSAWSTGNVVTTVTAPLAPISLSPDSVPQDLNEDLTFSWAHKHGGDGSTQTMYSLRYSTDAGSSWTDLYTDVASTTSSVTLPGGSLPNGSTYLWQVKTKGIDSGGYGPWSASATFIASARPTATVDAPLEASDVVALPLDVEWTYAQDDLSPQTGWQVQVVDPATNLVISSASADDASASASLIPPVVDGSPYKVQVRVRSGVGLWSYWSEVNVNVNLLPPVEVVVNAEYDRCTGTVVLAMEAGVAGPGQVAATKATVERQVPGGTWVKLVEEIELPVDFIDVVPAITGTNLYRITSISPTPSLSVGPEIEVVATGGDRGCGLWTFINYGPGFTRVLRVQGDPEISDKADRTRATHNFLGRSKPVVLVGSDTDRGVSFKGELHYDDWTRRDDPCRYDSAPAEWIQAALESEVVCYRDHTGRRLFGRLSGVEATERLHKGFGTVSFEVTEADYIEAGGIVGLESTLVAPRPPQTSSCNYVEADGPTPPAGEPVGTIWRNTLPAV